MEREEKIEKMAVDAINALHENDATLQALYYAIEGCSDERFHYHRDIVLKRFLCNAQDVEEKEDGRICYAYTDIEANEGSIVSHIVDNYPNYEDKSIFTMPDVEFEKLLASDLKKIAIESYTQYVFCFFVVCLNRIDPVANKTIANGVF